MGKAKIDKEKVLLQAAALASEKGLGNLNLRELAERLGIQPPSLYNHFAGIDDLKHEMMLYAIPKLTKEATLAVIGLSGMTALKAFCMAYYDFATENPGLYEAMQWWNRSADQQVDVAFADFNAVIKKILEPYHLDDERLQHVFCLLRGMAHGFASIAAFAGFGPDMPLKENFTWAMEVTFRGLEDTLGKSDA